MDGIPRPGGEVRRPFLILESRSGFGEMLDIGALHSFLHRRLEVPVVRHLILHPSLQCTVGRHLGRGCPVVGQGGGRRLHQDAARRFEGRILWSPRVSSGHVDSRGHEPGGDAPRGGVGVGVGGSEARRMCRWDGQGRVGEAVELTREYGILFLFLF